MFQALLLGGPSGCGGIGVVGTSRTLSVGEWDIALPGVSTPYKNWKFICSFYGTELNLPRYTKLVRLHIL